MSHRAASVASQPAPNLGEVGKVRAKMPRCTAFVDALRAAIGVDEINTVIKRGLRSEAAPAHQVRFAEAGQVLGHPPQGEAGVSVAQMVIGPPPAPLKRGRG